MKRGVPAVISRVLVVVNEVRRSTKTSSFGLSPYRREAQLHYVLRHPNIVDLLAYSETSPVCMVMERMEESLYDCIHSGIDLDVSTKMDLLMGITKVGRPVISRPSWSCFCWLHLIAENALINISFLYFFIRSACVVHVVNIRFVRYSAGS